MWLQRPFTFAAAVIIFSAIGFILIPRRRRPLLFLLGASAITIAAGEPTLFYHPATGVTVMLDVSPSTRGGMYRSRSVLKHRVAELLGSIPVRWLQFAGSTEPLAIDGNDVIDDIECNQTIFEPPTGQPILLFSDGRFDAPAKLPAVYPVIDPLLSDVADAAIEKLSIDGNHLTATVRAPGPTIVTFTSTSIPTATAPAGETLLDGGEVLAPTATARIDGHDRWPENDSLEIAKPPPTGMERWWIGNGAPGGWKSLHLDQIPIEAADYLGVGMIVLADGSSAGVDDAHQQALQRYVRDLGGALLLVGRVPPTGPLASISPLSYFPPEAARRWIILIDRSGSMSTAIDGQSKLQLAIDAAKRLSPTLPPADRVRIADFASTLNWWQEESSLADAVQSFSPPPVSASGPTNLQPALRQIADAVTDSIPTAILLVSDADASVDDATLADRFRQKKAAVNLLAIGDAPGMLRPFIEATGGRVLASNNPSAWANDLQTLAASIIDPQIVNQPATIHFRSDAALQDRTTDRWSHSWMKQSAIALTADEPRAARWPIGLGNVIATAFTLTDAELAIFDHQFATPAADPNLAIEWTNTGSLTVSIDADRNNRMFDLTIGDGAPRQIPQVAPNRYELTAALPRTSTAAVLREHTHILDRRVLPARYPPEFQSLGTDFPALQSLATRTGGAVISPAQHNPIDFHWPEKQFSLASLFAVIGTLLLATWALRRT